MAKDGKKLTPEERLKRDYEEAKSRAEGGGGTFWTAEEGENVIRILPPWTDGENFYRKVPYHYGVYPKNERLGLICPKGLLGEPCPICETAEKYYERGGKNDLAKAKELKPRDQYLVNLMLVTTPSGQNEGEVRVFRFGPTIFKQIVEIMTSQKWGDPTDPVKGRALSLRRTGTTKEDTDYNVLPEPERSAVPKDVLKKGFDLADDGGTIEIFTYEQIEKLLEGEELDDVRGEDGRPTPKREKGGKAEAEPEKEAVPEIDRKTLRKLLELVKEHDLDLGEAEEPADIFGKVKDETTGMKTKSFEKEELELLEGLGATVDGKLIEWTKQEPEEPEEAGEIDDIKQSIAELKKRKEAAKADLKGKKK